MPISRGKAVGTRDYDGSMGLALVVGPAKAGKVAHLLEGYLEAIERDPVLIVPGRADVERIERDLLARCGALLAGSIGTFDDVFRELALGGADARPVLSDAQRALVARRVLGRTALNGLGRSARFAGFADSLLAVLSELESGLLDPGQLDGDLALLYGAYREELDRLALWDRDLLRRRAVERLQTDLDAWDGRPVFAYGFEDLTSAEWGLLEALAARTELTVSLPYEPGRAAFASLGRTQEDLASLAGGRIEELPRARGRVRPRGARPSRAASLRGHGAAGPPLDGAVRFFEGAGARGSLELVAEEIRELFAAGTPLEEIALVVPSVERWRASLETVLGTLGIPFAIEGPAPLRPDALRPGAALAAALRVAAGRSPRSLRVPPLAVLGLHALERRLPRGKAPRPRHLHTRHRRGGDDQAPRRTAAAAAGGAPHRRRPVAAVRTIAATMLADAHGLEAPPVGEASRGDLRAYDAIVRLLDELDGWQALGGDALGGRGARGARARRGADRLGRRARPGCGPRARAAPGHAASTPSSCSASRRARCRAAGTPRRSSTTTFAASSTGMRRRGSCGRTRSSASAISSTPPARGRPAG